MILWTEYDDDHMGKYRGTDDSNKPTTIAAYHHDKGWFHIDPNPQTKPKFAFVQSLVNLLPVIENTDGNVVVIGSYKMFPNHYLRSSKSSSDDVDVDVVVNEFYYKRLKEMNGDDWLEIDPNDTLLQKESNVYYFFVHSYIRTRYTHIYIHTYTHTHTQSLLTCEWQQQQQQYSPRSQIRFRYHQSSSTTVCEGHTRGIIIYYTTTL